MYSSISIKRVFAAAATLGRVASVHLTIETLSYTLGIRSVFREEEAEDDLISGDKEKWKKRLGESE